MSTTRVRRRAAVSGTHVDVLALVLELVEPISAVAGG